MHPLRFPNSGIRDKVFMRKIDFKLRVMRLNHVELFYAVVATIGSESRRCLWGRGGKLWPGPLQGATVLRGSNLQGAPARGHDQLRPARKGLPPTANPVASRGDGVGHKGGRPLAGRLPTVKGSCRLCRGSDGDDTVRVKEG
ncbi:hypothetical protein B296_00045520 [Ensete ventricosum]|uniref:Uncharacterized protein n=1 Tax=Ensete ventricosum TaxID=4639 RepID=A0A426XDD0_ENSVE|nr:hypothetical protein B296_00045520 [Ensete ventricosum]